MIRSWSHRLPGGRERHRHRLWHAVPAFPNVSEIWLHLMEDYGL